MELRRYLSLLRRRWPVVLVTVLVAVAAAYLATPRERVYSATSTIVIGPRQFSSDNAPSGNGVNISNDQATGLERLAKTYSVLIKSEPVAADAAALTGLDVSAESIVNQTQAFPLPGTQLLVILYSDSDPARAQSMANGLAQAFVTKVQSFRPDQAASVGTLPEVPVYVYEQARLPVVPKENGLTGNLLVAALFGFLAAVGLILLLEHLDITVKSVEDAERRLELPVLGAVPLFPFGSGPIVGPGTKRRLHDVSRPSA